MHLKNYNSFNTTPRLWCTAGRRHFYIGSNGDVARCAGFWYGHKTVLGNINDQNLRSSIISLKDYYQSCDKPKCTMECDGYLVNQVINTTPPTTHLGSKLTDYNIAGRDFCTLMVHLTAICNMKCPYCCAQGWMEAHRGQDISLEDWKDAAIFFTKSFETGFIEVMGGEPTVKKGWEDILRIFIDAGWHIELLTNMAKDKAVVDFIKSLPSEKRHLCLVYISMHPTQKIFNADNLMIALHELNNLKASFACSLVQTPENVRIAKEMDLENRVRNMGIKWFGTVPAYDYAPATDWHKS